MQMRLGCGNVRYKQSSHGSERASVFYWLCSWTRMGSKQRWQWKSVSGGKAQRAEPLMEKPTQAARKQHHDERTA